jgi:hypothetical protein
MAEEFPEKGKRYTLENLPERIPSGRHKVILNGIEDVLLFSTGGNIYISMEKAAALVDRSALGYRQAVIKIEKDENRKLRWKFGGREVWMKIEDVKAIYFTPQPVGDGEEGD